MATVVGQFEKGTKVISNLDTYNHTAATAGMFTVTLAMSEQPPSGLTIQIKQNSTVIATSTTPAATQGIVQLQAIINAAVNDVIGVVVSSSTPTDQAINQIKGILNIRPGTN
jgi:hypothetical protein